MQSVAPSEPAARHETNRRPAIVAVAVAGLALPLILLAATARTAEYPARELGSECRMLLILYPLAFCAALRHAARRSPRLLLAALLLFVMAATVRTGASCYITAVHARDWAPLVGASNSDAYLYSLAARFVASSFTSETYHVESEWQSVEYIDRIRSLFGGDPSADELPLAVNIMAWTGALLPVTGFSTMALNVVMILLGSFFCVQVFVMLSRFCRPVVVVLVITWVVIGPEYVWFSAGYYKEMPACVALIYLADYLLNLPLRSRLTMTGACGCIAMLVLAREQYAYFAIPMIGYALWDVALIRAETGQRGRNLLAVTSFVGIAVMLNLARTRYEAGLFSWLTGYVNTVLVLPPLTWFLSPELFTNSVMTVMLPLAFLWLPVGAGLLLAAFLTKAGHLHLPQRLVMLVLVFCLMISITLPNTNTIVRYRLPCEPFMQAFALEAFAVLRQLQPSRQAILLRLSALWVVLQIIASVADSLRSQLRG